MEKVLISGTGRCGTTFIMKILTLLDYNTGFTKEKYLDNINETCNAGLELPFHKKNKDVYIFKSPIFIQKIKSIIEYNKSWMKIKLMIIPVRHYESSAESRVKNGNGPGGLWEAKNKQEQISFYKKIMADYIYYMEKYGIKTIFLNFGKMIGNKNYLYHKLKPLMDEKNVSFEKFSLVFDEASSTSKPKK